MSINAKGYGRDFSSYLLSLEEVWWVRENSTRPSVVKVMRKAYEIEDLERELEERREELALLMKEARGRVTRSRTLPTYSPVTTTARVVRSRDR